jgi:hypothetical protein
MAGSPNGGHTINGQFFDINFNYGSDSYIATTTEAEALYNRIAQPPLPVHCDCGGPVMTAERTFSDNSE